MKIYIAWNLRQKSLKFQLRFLATKSGHTICPPPSPIIHEVPRHFCILICKSVHLSVKLKHVMDNVSPFVTNSYYFIGHILSFESSKATCVISLVCIKKILSCFVSQALNYAIQLFFKYWITSSESESNQCPGRWTWQVCFTRGLHYLNQSFWMILWV
jgi:hypothetical protein